MQLTCNTLGQAPDNYLLNDIFANNLIKLIYAYKYKKYYFIYLYTRFINN